MRKSFRKPLFALILALSVSLAFLSAVAQGRFVQVITIDDQIVNPVAAEYIRDMPLTDDPDLWTPHFRAAVARLLASKLAGPVTNEDGLVDKHMRIYETVDLPNAQFYDAVQDNSNENSEHDGRLATSKFLQARYTARYGGTEPNDLY